MELPMDRFLNLVYYFVTDGVEPQERDKFDLRLNKPDTRPQARARNTAAAKGPWSAKGETDALSMFVAQTSGKVAAG